MTEREYTTHTPGPWTTRGKIDGSGSAQIRAEDGKIWIGGAMGSHHTPSQRVNHSSFPADTEGEANARLIAAAPELLEALKAIVDMVPIYAKNHPRFNQASRLERKTQIDAARAAIAKAEGGAG